MVDLTFGIMLLNYLKIALRVLTRNKLVSIINIFGLALALGGGLLIAIFVADELSYDRYNEHADRVYRVTRNFLSNDGSVDMHLGQLAPPFAPLLKNDYPDILEYVRTAGPISRAITPEHADETRSYAVENAYFAEPAVFKIFSIDVLSNSEKTQLEKPGTIMISDQIAMRFFGNTDVVGRSVKIFDQTLEITGVYKSVPRQSHWHPDVLISFSTLNDPALFGAEQLQTNWENNSFLTYILVNEQFDALRTEQSFPDFIDKHMPAAGDSRKRSVSTNLFLQPLTSIHLHSHLDSEAETNGNINHVYAMESIGVFLVVIACFNFINLATARATQRGKEVGLRKVSGAQRRQLIFQHISESTLTTLLSMIVALALATALLPWLNDFTGKTIALRDLINFDTVLVLTSFVLAVGALAGIYPAFVISAYQPIQILKGQNSRRDRGSIRKALVVIQFSISIVLIITTMVTYQQLQFLNNKDLGYAKDQVVSFPYDEDLEKHYDAFYNELSKYPGIVKVARSNRMPTVRLLETNHVIADHNGQKADVVMKNVSVDQNFFETYGISFMSGKNYPREIRQTDTFETKITNGFILNETAARLLGWTNDEAVGKEITNGGIKASVIGIVKDFHFESLHEPIAPIVFMTYASFRQISVLITASAVKENLAHLEKVWQQTVTKEPLAYEFLNERYARLYESEADQQELFVIFALLAIFIASLGLFGLATFNTLQRSKEVSIRKVLGASVQSILQLLSREIVILIIIANVIAWPLAWYLMGEWLGAFAYHVEMNILTYVTAGLLTMVVTLVTITTQTLKAALTNPASMLRSE